LLYHFFPYDKDTTIMHLRIAESNHSIFYFRCPLQEIKIVHRISIFGIEPIFHQWHKQFRCIIVYGRSRTFNVPPNLAPAIEIW